MTPNDSASRSGEQVRLQTRRGELVLAAWIDGRGAARQGICFVPFFDERKLINRLTLEAHCPFSKRARLQKCGPSR